MSDNKQVPRCPYCGNEMRIRDNENVVMLCYNGDEAQRRYWYSCNNDDCKSNSPQRKSELSAYRAAMQLNEEPNRVLTLGEAQNAVYKTDAPIPCELRWYLSAISQIAWIADAVTSYHELPKDMQEAIEREEKVKDVDDLNGAYIQWRENLDWKNYGTTWRCWLRKPSSRETRDTPWEIR